MDKQDGKAGKNNLHTFELITTTQVPDEILCKYCMHKLEPLKSAGFTLGRHTNAYCKKYPHGECSGKPNGVLWGFSVDCRYFSLDVSTADEFYEFVVDFEEEEAIPLVERIEKEAEQE